MMVSTIDEIDYLLLHETGSTPTALKNVNDLKISESQIQDITSLSKRGRDGRLIEIKQQLEIAESRCDTLKQQLDYMMNLYHSAHKNDLPEYKKDNSRRKGKSKNKGKKFNTESSLEKKVLDPSIRKTSNKLSGNSSNFIKNSPCNQTKKGEKISSFLLDVANYEILGPCGEYTENITHEFPNRDINLQSRPVSGNSRPLSMSSRPKSLCSRRPASTPVVVQDISEVPSLMEGDENSKLESIQVIQNILSGITNSVNRISELNDYIEDNGREAYSDNPRGEGILNTFYKNEFQQNEEYKIGKAKEHGVQTSDDPNQQFNSNCCSNNNAGQNYEQTPSTTKKKKSRAAKRDVPPKLLVTPYTTESIKSIRGKKRKTKLYGKQVEKKSKGIGSSHLHTNKQTKITEDAISVTTKIRKKRTSKLGNCNSKNSSLCKSIHRDLSNKKNLMTQEIRDSPLSEVFWHSDNVVELYHNSSLHAETSASDDAFTRLSHPSKSQEYPQKEANVQRDISQQKIHRKKQDEMKKDNGYYISHNLGDVITDRIMQTAPSEDQLHRVFGTPHLGKHNSIVSAEDVNNADVSLQEQDKIKITKNFQLPTVSSKLKQVDKSLFPRLNFRNIPFVAGTSTSPSHNLGLNIQQVLSIIKMRQPLRNYKPEVLNTQLFGLKQNQITNSMSRHCSHISHRTPNPNFDFPEKDNMLRNEMSNPSCYCNVNCPSTRPATAVPFCRDGVELNSTSSKIQRPENPWAVDQNYSGSINTKSNVNCDFFPTNRYVNYHKILNQYLEGSEKLSFLRPSQGFISYKSQPLRPHYSTISRMPHPDFSMPPVMSGHSLKERHINQMTDMQVGKESITLKPDINGIKQKDPDFFVNIQGKAKSLKDVFTNLHDDFKRLNNKYEEIQAGVSQDSVDEIEALKQLDAMEAELQAKEEEITVVMALYKEVISLKEQVRSLRECANLGNFTQQPVTRLKPRRLPSREPTTGVRLTILLRTIQKFQDRLRHD